jgi:hypothetical protein
MNLVPFQVIDIRLFKWLLHCETLSHGREMIYQGKDGLALKPVETCCYIENKFAHCKVVGLFSGAKYTKLFLNHKLGAMPMVRFKGHLVLDMHKILCHFAQNQKSTKCFGVQSLQTKVAIFKL